MKTDKSPASLSPQLYDKEYYLKSLPGFDYLKKGVIDPAILETIRLGKITPEDHVLDFGCGRGELVIEAAKRGSHAVGMDFSKDAVEFAQTYLKNFPEDVQKRARFEQMTFEDLSSENEFDVIVFNQVYEHLYDYELRTLLGKFKRALKQNGRLIISTPNLNYIRFLYPLKRILEFPFKVIKQISRLLRGRSKHAQSIQAFFRELFKIKYPESEHTKLHINLQTPQSIQKFLEGQGFSVRVLCIDTHKNLISQLTQRWWGETVWAVCGKTKIEKQ